MSTEFPIKPLADKVVIEPTLAEERTATGLYIPDTAKKTPQQGKVVAVGSGTKEKPMTLKPGDKVLHREYGGVEVPLRGKTYLIISASDVLAILI